jgi:hypothetical protein
VLVFAPSNAAPNILHLKRRQGVRIAVRRTLYKRIFT